MKQKNVILMVVAVGCGLVAAVLTSQMSAKGNTEQVEVLVAAKDLPVGTMLTREDLASDKFVKTKKLPKDGLPPNFIANRDDLVDKRLSRPVRAEETFNPQDLNKGGAITLPVGYNMVSLQLGAGQAAAGFVGPGSRVNVLATVRSGNRLSAFPLLVNMLVVAVDTQTTYGKDGVFPTLNMVSFAVTQKQALLLSLAKSRGCSLELMLRGDASQTPEQDLDYDIDKVVKIMSDDRDTKTGIVQTGSDANKEPGAKPNAPDAPKPDTPKVVTPKPEAPKVAELPTAPYPREKILVVRVLIAKRSIAPNTEVTADLIAEAFEYKELPIGFASDALGDLTPALGKTFLSGVSKGHWVTSDLLGIQVPKPTPQYKFSEPKPGPAEDPSPVEPLPPPARRKTLDVSVHTTSGTIIHRYEEYAPGKWKKIAELTPAQASREDRMPDEPKAAPDAKKATD